MTKKKTRRKLKDYFIFIYFEARTRREVKNYLCLYLKSYIE